LVAVDIDGRPAVTTVTPKNVDNRDLWSVDILPRPDARLSAIMDRHS
jgi:alkaline phosphatase D